MVNIIVSFNNTIAILSNKILKVAGLLWTIRVSILYMGYRLLERTLEQELVKTVQKNQTNFSLNMISNLT